MLEDTSAASAITNNHAPSVFKIYIGVEFAEFLQDRVFLFVYNTILIKDINTLYLMYIQFTLSTNIQ